MRLNCHLLFRSEGRRQEPSPRLHDSDIAVNDAGHVGAPLVVTDAAAD